MGKQDGQGDKENRLMCQLPFKTALVFVGVVTTFVLEDYSCVYNERIVTQSPLTAE
jgi:hypothetical protein